MTTINSVGNGLTGATGTGLFVGQTSPSLITPALGIPSSGNLMNCTGLPGEFVWAANATTSISAAVGNGYILTSGSTTTVTLPTTFAVGDRIAVAGNGAAWIVALGAATNVKAFGNTYTTSLASTNNSDTLALIGVVANTTWDIISMSSAALTAS